MSKHKQEFQAFYKKRVLFVYRYTYSRIGCREEVEDLMALIKAFRSRALKSYS